MSSTTASRIAVFFATNKVSNNTTNVPTSIADTDAALLFRVSQKDTEALADLFQLYAPYVRGIAYKVLRDEGEAADLVQEVFLLIHRMSGQFDRSRGTARSWIAQIAYTRALTRRRHLTSRHHYAHVNLDGHVLSVVDTQRTADRYEDSLEGTFGRETFSDTFNALSEDQRETLRLFFFEGLTLDEIARKMGRSRSNIKHYYFRGLDRLRRSLKANTETV